MDKTCLFIMHVMLTMYMSGNIYLVQCLYSSPMFTRRYMNFSEQFDYKLDNMSWNTYLLNNCCCYITDCTLTKVRK